jgi:hypothetical protein
MRIPDSAQSVMVSKTSLLLVKKCKNDLSREIIIFFRTFSAKYDIIFVRTFSYFFNRTWRLIHFCVDQSLQEVIWHNNIAYFRIDIEYNVIIFVDIYIFVDIFTSSKIL